MPPLSRREFLLLGVASGAAVAVGVVLPISIASRDEVDGDGAPATSGPAAVVALFPRARIARVSELRDGAPVLFDYPLQGQGNVLVKMGQPAIGGVGDGDDIVAFSRICTHMGCELTDYRHEHGVLGPCPCHFSTFDLIHNGQVTLGQATQNLPQVLLEIDGDEVFATGVVRLVYGFADTLEGAEMVAGA